MLSQETKYLLRWYSASIANSLDDSVWHRYSAVGSIKIEALPSCVLLGFIVAHKLLIENLPLGTVRKPSDWDFSVCKRIVEELDMIAAR